MPLALLQIDNKLIAIQMKPFLMFNITGHVVNHVIRKITFNCKRIIILTTTSLYYLYVVDQKFKLIDITESVTSSVPINDITFVSNSYETLEGIGIFTNNGRIFVCNIEYGKVIKCTYLCTLTNKNIETVSNEDMGYIRKHNNNYNVVHIQGSVTINTVCTLSKLPTLLCQT